VGCPIKERFVGYHVLPTRNPTNLEMITLNRKGAERKCSLRGSGKAWRCGRCEMDV
jgi:hypothetical protein